MDLSTAYRLLYLQTLVLYAIDHWTASRLYIIHASVNNCSSSVDHSCDLQATLAHLQITVVHLQTTVVHLWMTVVHLQTTVVHLRLLQSIYRPLQCTCRTLQSIQSLDGLECSTGAPQWSIDGLERSTGALQWSRFQTTVVHLQNALVHLQTTVVHLQNALVQLQTAVVLLQDTLVHLHPSSPTIVHLQSLQCTCRDHSSSSVGHYKLLQAIAVYLQTTVLDLQTTVVHLFTTILILLSLCSDSGLQWVQYSGLIQLHTVQWSYFYNGRKSHFVLYVKTAWFLPKTM